MQSILITAYHKFNQLIQLSELLSKRFEVFIHIDKKVNNTFLPSNDRIHCYNTYQVKWGGCNHLRAILYLMQEALKDPNISHCHLISGDDWPVRSLDDIYEHFEHNNEIDILCTRLSMMTPEWYEVCRAWQQYYHYLDRFDYKKLPTKIFVKLFVEVQALLHVDRYKQIPSILGDGAELAQGLVWGSYPRDAIEYCLGYLKEYPALFDFLAKGQAAEEYFFQTILVNNPDYEKRITNHHYRYMNWTRKNGSYPGILDMEDLENIRDGNWHFCRKVDLKISKRLIETLNIS